MNELALQLMVQAECDRLGLLHHHCPDSRRCSGTPGIPDLIIASMRGVIFAELKSADGETSAEQDLWALNLDMVSRSPRELRYLRYYLWRPEDWDSGAITRQLGELAG